MEIQELQKQGMQVLKQAQIPEDRRKVNSLLAYLTGMDVVKLMTHEKEEVAEEQVQAFFAIVHRLISGEPIQYITHFQEFMGLPFYVTKDVLIPQPDTEILVEETLKCLLENATVLDLCTGSGCVGVSLAHYAKNVNKVVLADISQEALEIAKKNVQENGVQNKVEILQTNLWENITGKYDAIASNPPYIPTTTIETLSQEVQNEPKLALDGGEDGLVFYRKILEKADQYLEYGGYLLCEIGFDQAEAVKRIWEELKERNVTKLQWEKVQQDLAGLDRVVILRRE